MCKSLDKNSIDFMKILISFLLILCSFSTLAQNGITFQVEELSKPEKLLETVSCDKVYKKLILSDVSMAYDECDDTFPFNIIAKSNCSEELVNFHYKSFFYGIYQAYAEHRPFVLSPDMIWLLISQGFARHVNANSESLREHFVDFSGELLLTVRIDKRLDDPDFSWEEVFPEFTKQIGQHTGNGLIETLSCDFSTTTPVEKVASEITIMEAMKSYFEFIVEVGCGIPEVTLLGTPEDWQKVLDKTKKLKKYDLDWWISELEPILQEFVNASNGNINKEVWKNMFKYHEQIYAPGIVDGWIVKFFPYDKDGNKNGLQKLESGDNLPDEIIKVDLKMIEIFDNNNTTIETPLELWAGCIGLEQNKNNFALTPKIGWMIRKKDVGKLGLKKKLEEQAKQGYIQIAVTEFPTVLLEFKEIGYLGINFTNDIEIPDEFSTVKIDRLVLSGKITGKEIERIKALFPNSNILINGNIVN